MVTTWNRVRRLLGVHDLMLVAAFLAANSFVEVTVDLLGGTSEKIAWVVLMAAATALLALRASRKLGPTPELKGSDFGVWAGRRIGQRRAAVVVVGLDSDQPGGALAKLLAEATSLEYLALIGTHETRAGGVTERIVDRLLPACGATINGDHIRVWDHNNALSVGDFAEATGEALAWLARCGVEDRDVVVDVTAGRRMAGFGALQAADAAHVETQYLAFRWDHVAHRPVRDQPAFRVVSTYWSGSDRDVEEQLGAAAPEPEPEPV
jgi:hypothetical protein